MKQFLKGLAFTAILFCHNNFLLAQGRTGYFIGTGMMTYNGDINEKSDKIISPSKVFKPYIKGGINYRISNRIEASIAYMYGNVGGADSLAVERDNRNRNQSFRSRIHEVSVQVEYHLMSVYKKHRLNPFAFAGAGLFHFNPQGQLNGVWYNLRPLGTEGQFIEGGDYSKPYKLTQLSMPMGLGIYVQLNSHWRVRLEYAHHFTKTDYLDDVSNAYPDLDQLAATVNGDLAVQLSNRRLVGTSPPPGRPRGNPKYNDSFSALGVMIIYNPGELRIGKPHNAKKFSKMNQKLLRGKAMCRGGWR